MSNTLSSKSKVDESARMNFVRFMTLLASDPARLAEFNGDPEGEMNKSKLTDEQMQAVLSKDPARIKSLLAGGAVPLAGFTIEIVAVIHF